MKILGIALVILGIVGLAYGGLSWTRSEKVIDLGSVEVTQNKTERIPFSPLAGGLSLAAGVGLLVMSSRKK